MTKPKSTDELLKSGLNRAGGMLKNLGLRIVVHLASAGTSLALALSRFTPEGGGISAFFSFYLGFICLVPGGMAASAAWCVPVACGVIQAALLACFGLPLHAAVFWGGFQVWVQRMLQSGGRMGHEWLSAVFLLPLGVYLVSSYPHLALASIPLLAVAGWRFVAEYGRRRLVPEYRRLMYHSIENFRKLLDSGKMPKALAQASRDFIRLGLPYLESGGKLPERALLALPEVKSVAARTDAMLPSGSSGTGAAGAASAAVSGQDGEDAMIARLGALNAEFSRHLAQRGAAMLELPRSLADFKDSELLMARFRGFIAVLSVQKQSLPPEQQASVEGICRAAEGILDGMAASADRVQPGGRFLQRYLKAAHKVVSEQDIIESEDGLIASSGDILVRLEEAFRAEENRLKRKDVSEFDVDLKMIDMLLKMDGH